MPDSPPPGDAAREDELPEVSAVLESDSVEKPAEAATPSRGVIGRVLSDRYRVDALIARGGMGAVYRGEHVRMRKPVAIKLLHPSVEAQPEIVARFEREAIAGANVSHPNVVAATDFGELPDGTYFLILDYV